MPDVLLAALLCAQEKVGEFAPGIPKKGWTAEFPTFKKPVPLEFGLHHHKSEGPAKEHFDLRLGDPDTGHAHSWAMKYWPKPGENRLAVMQPTHTIEYMDFEGRIPEGYGKGDVSLAKRSKTEIVSSSKGHVRFNLYNGKSNEEFLLRHTDGNKWLLRNITPTKESVDIPLSKPKYKVISAEDLDPENPNTVLQAKIDGAHVLFNFKDTGSTPDIFSYRPTARATGLIEHTHRVPGVLEQRTPKELKNTVLRGELYAVDRRNRALSAAQVGGILNANVWKSREKQKEEGKLVPTVFDVVKWKGKDVSDAPFEEKQQLLQEAVKAAPWLKIPRTATTPKQKEKLIADIKSGKEPSTEEGVIEWHLDKSIPRKAKFLREEDAFVRGIFKEEGKHLRPLAGGFEMSRTHSGPVVGRVGTGFSLALKKDMIENPDKYIGLQARIKTTPAPAKYAPRAAKFVGWHLDQDLPENIKHASGFLKEMLILLGDDHAEVDT